MASPITIAITECTKIASHDPTVNYGTNATLTIGDGSSTASIAMRTLLRPSLAGIPAGATITRVIVQLQENFAANAAPGPSSWAVNFHRCLKAWTEALATYNTIDGSTAWNTAGGADNLDRAEAASATLTLDATEDTVNYSSWDSNTAGNEGLITDVQGWLDSTFTNNGWWIQAPTAEFQGTTGYSFSEFESENSTDANKPQVIVYYTEGTSATVTVSAGSMVMTGAAATLLASGGTEVVTVTAGTMVLSGATATLTGGTPVPALGYAAINYDGTRNASITGVTCIVRYCLDGPVWVTHATVALAERGTTGQWEGTCDVLPYDIIEYIEEYVATDGVTDYVWQRKSLQADAATAADITAAQTAILDDASGNRADIIAAIGDSSGNAATAADVIAAQTAILDDASGNRQDIIDAIPDSSGNAAATDAVLSAAHGSGSWGAATPESWVSITEATLDSSGNALGALTISGVATGGIALTAYLASDATRSTAIARTYSEGDGGYVLQVPPSATYVLRPSYAGDEWITEEKEVVVP